jgi:hypothetical protein
MERFIQYIPTIYKAITAGITSGIAAYGLAIQDGMSWGEWGYVIATSIGVGLLTFAKSNKEPSVTPTSSGPEPVA